MRHCPRPRVVWVSPAPSCLAYPSCQEESKGCDLGDSLTSFRWAPLPLLDRYLELINQELEKLEQLAEENQRLALAQDDKKKQGLEKRKQLLLRKKMEEVGGGMGQEEEALARSATACFWVGDS